MAKVSIHEIASGVAAILGESLALDCRPEESPFPDIEDRVRIMAPAVLASLTTHPSDIRPYPSVAADDTIELRDSLRCPLILKLAEMLK